MDTTADQIEAYVAEMRRYLKENASLAAVLASLAIAAYGFELFNLNLTIDEEVQAFLPYGRHYISHGRWGLFLLNKFLLPFPVIPFVPLFIALVFHIGAVLMLLYCWEVESKLDRFVAGALGVAYPGMAYFYMFSISNYAIGIGLFCSALSLFLFTRISGRSRFFSVIPAVLALSIYQAFTVVLAAAFLVRIMSSGLRNGRKELNLRNIAEILLVGAVSFVIYYLINRVFLTVSGIPMTYVDQILDFSYLRENTAAVLSGTLEMVRDVYGGSRTIYATEVRVFGIIVILSLFGLIVTVLRSSLKTSRRLLVFLLAVLLLLLPFVVGLFTRGSIPVRFMVALPVVISGVAVLGMRAQARNFRLLMGLSVLYCVFQFVVSINYLNSSSHLALQADRLLASHVISRIEDARVAAGLQELKYLDVVGYRERPPSPLMPKSDTFGASFFEWDQGNAWRVIFFLRTLGYYNSVEALPVERRGRMFETASAMPHWPAPGSVEIDGDAVIVKFSDYSLLQKKEICDATQNPEFCK
ncbi:MAG: glucosyltransferase domain-containing protein [Thermodesulfovibrionales bacterium]